MTGSLRAIVLVAALCGSASCGGSSTSPSSPSTPAATVGATITITNGAAAPRNATINIGEVVMVVNNDSRAREIASDPHPAHTDCAALNTLGSLQPGQSRNTSALTAARTCGFHDHIDPTNANLQGTITIR